MFVYILKSLLFVLGIIIFFINIDNSFAIENNFEIEYKIIPEQIHENDIILLEIYKTIDGNVSFEKIKDLKIESADTSIINIVDFDEMHEYKILVKLKAINKGSTNLYLFAEGTQAIEIPIIINGNNIPSEIELDIFPDTFEVGKNNQGIMSILLKDSNGLVTKADKDYLINISASKPGIMSLSDYTVIIPKGDFGSKQDFTVINKGDITMTIKTGELEDSEVMTIIEESEKEISILTIPDDINSSNTSSGHLIAQLTSGGNLVKATEDITIFFEIESDTVAATANTSLDYTTVNPKGHFQIKKGQTYGHELFSIQKGLEDGHTIIATAQNPLTIVEETFETLDVELYGDEKINFEAISVLADGNRQLVGVIYLEDENGHPVIADRDIVVPFTAPDKSISIENSIIKKGFESALVFGNMGQYIPDDSDIAPNIENFEVVSLDIDGISEESISLETHIVTDHLIKDEQHWIILYMESGGEVIKIPNNQFFEISDSEIFKIDKEKIIREPYFIIIPITGIKSGDDEIVISSDKFETTVSLSSIVSKPNSLEMKYSDNLFKGVKDTFTIQILDSQGLPVKTNEDVEIKIFSTNPLIINFPKSATIPQKSSFISLDAIPESSGEVEISLVSEGLSIVSEEIKIEEATPTIKITGAEIIEQGESFIVSLLAKQNGMPLKNANIIWELEGGIPTMIEEKTGPTGEAVASIISTSDNSVKISATIDNGPIQSAFASKIIRVNASSLENPIKEEDESFKKPNIEGIDPIMIMIPALIGGIVIYMKKKKSK